MIDPVLVRQVAAHHGIEAEVLAAVIQQESGGDVWAFRMEPRYPFLWDVRKKRPFRRLTANEVAAKEPPSDFRSLAGTASQEWIAQQSSFGLCQIMGALARELGFSGPYLTAILEPSINLNLAAQHLRALQLWSGYDLGKTLGAYNAGKGGATSRDGLAYANQVIAKRDALVLKV